MSSDEELSRSTEPKRQKLDADDAVPLCSEKSENHAQSIIHGRCDNIDPKEVNDGKDNDAQPLSVGTDDDALPTNDGKGEDDPLPAIGRKAEDGPLPVSCGNADDALPISAGKRDDDTLPVDGENCDEALPVSGGNGEHDPLPARAENGEDGPLSVSGGNDNDGLPEGVGKREDVALPEYGENENSTLPVSGGNDNDDSLSVNVGGGNDPLPVSGRKCENEPLAVSGGKAEDDPLRASCGKAGEGNPLTDSGKDEDNSLPVSGRKGENEPLVVSDGKTEDYSLPSGGKDEEGHLLTDSRKGEYNPISVSARKGENEPLAVGGGKAKEEPLSISGGKTEDDPLLVSGGKGEECHLLSDSRKCEDNPLPVSGRKDDDDPIPVSGGNGHDDALRVKSGAEGDEDKNRTSSSEDEFIGPQPVLQDLTLTQEPKRKKMLAYEDVYLGSLPNADYYEKSFMHREPVSHIAVTKTDFIITASCDGHIKFWKKQELGIEFVKHFRTHLGNVQDISVSATGTLLASVSNDKSLKVFDVVNFDMINMLKLDFTPQACEWIYRSGDAIFTVAVSDADSNLIYIFDGQGTKEPIKMLDNIHRHPVTIIKYNPVIDAAISVDTQGMVEYWTGPKREYTFPRNLSFDSKLDTDLFEFVTNKLTVCCLTISPNGKYFATLTSDRRVCLFNFLTGKLIRVFDEDLSNILEHQAKVQLIPQMEFGRRLAVERDLEKHTSLKTTNMIFDESSNFLLYPTVLGIKVVNLVTNKLQRLIGKPENLRFLQIALFQGKPKKSLGVPTLEMEAADNPTLDGSISDPTLFCTAYKKNRFYLFSRRDASKSDQDRDVFNEKPTKEDIISATDSASVQKIHEEAVLHTTKGDIHLKIFVKECPKTAENFCVHAKNGYYNGNIFHRVIKGFMCQTGDPTGIGTGGESIWGGEFEDEFHPSLRHDRPYTVSMANAGPNTNGSQFFITTTPTSWLDNKHTVFGRVTRGMETIQSISIVKTNPKTDKPYDDISIINITLK